MCYWAEANGFRIKFNDDTTLFDNLTINDVSVTIDRNYVKKCKTHDPVVLILEGIFTILPLMKCVTLASYLLTSLIKLGPAVLYLTQFGDYSLKYDGKKAF